MALFKLRALANLSLVVEENEEFGQKWRNNAAAVILNPRREVLLCRPKGHNAHWHFPQGGVRGRESERQALQREVWEETGLLPSQYDIKREISGFKYFYPDKHEKKNKWIGQNQTWFLLTCHEIEPKIDFSYANEFSEYCWVLVDELNLELFSPEKRSVLARVLPAFFDGETIDLLTKVKMKQEVEMMNRFEKYLVRPGRNLEWGMHDPKDELFFDGTKSDGREEFDVLRDELAELQKLLFAENKNKLLVIIQAMDAGGKDGLVKNVFSRLDPQGLRVTAFKKPNEEEMARDFLWRIHQVVPRNGEIGVFNRSHYEDIIAVRVKNLLPEAQWRRRYRHIVDFEKMLADEGTIIVKLFLHISRPEQKARLESRLADPSKMWKFQEDDLTDRQRWPMFMEAYREIIQHTSTPQAPWYIIPADRKWYRNLMVTQLLVNKLSALNMKYPKPNFDPTQIVIPD